MTALDPSAVDRIAGERQAAMDRRDVEALRRLYSPDVAIWHNIDQVEQTLEQNLQTMEWLLARMPDTRFDEVRRQTTPGGFVEQYVIRGTAPDGTPVEAPACLVVSVDGDRITRMEEYLDSGHLAALTRRSEPAAG